MWRLLSVGVLLVTLELSLHTLNVLPAYACSAGPEFDPVADSAVIVEGRVLAYQVLPDAPLAGVDDTKGYDFTRDAYIPVRIELAVKHVYKGSAPVTISIVDPRTLGPPISPGGEYEWIGASGACGTFDEDPTGRYMIIGLSRRDDGSYSSDRLLVFYYGGEPSGDVYNKAVAELTSRTDSAAGRDWLLPAVSAAAAGLTLLAVGLAVARLRARGGGA